MTGDTYIHYFQKGRGGYAIDLTERKVGQGRGHMTLGQEGVDTVEGKTAAGHCLSQGFNLDLSKAQPSLFRF